MRLLVVLHYHRPRSAAGYVAVVLAILGWELRCCYCRCCSVVIQVSVLIKRMKRTIREEIYEGCLLYKEVLSPSKEGPSDQTSASFKRIFITSNSECLLLSILTVYHLPEHSKPKPSKCNSHSQSSSSPPLPPRKTGPKEEETTTNNPQTTSPLHQEEPTHPVLLKATKAEAGPTSQLINRLLQPASSRRSRRLRLMTGGLARTASC